MNNEEHKINKVNHVFLATVLISVFASLVLEYMCKGINLILPGTGTRIYDLLINDYFATLIFSQIVLFLPAFIFIVMNRKYFFSHLRIKKLKLETYGWIILFGIFFIPIISFVNSISLLFAENVMASEVTEVVSSHSLLASIIVIALIPCVLEETIYRGVFYNEYSRVNPLKAMFLSALLFGLLHMNLNQFMYAAVGGFVFAVIVEATGSITATMMMHFMINGTSTIVSYFSSNLMEKASDLSVDVNSNVGTQGFTGAMSFMNNLTAIQQAVVSLGIIAVICLAFEVVIFSQILKSEGRREYFWGLFKKNKTKVKEEANHTLEDAEGSGKNDTGVEKNDEEENIMMITPTLAAAMIICVFVIGIRQLLGV